MSIRPPFQNLAGHGMTMELTTWITDDSSLVPSFKFADFSTFFIGGGLPSTESSKVEVFQLSSTYGQPVFNSSICRKRAGLDLLDEYTGLAHPVTASFEDHILVCGGSLGLKSIKGCRSYSFSNNEWTTLESTELLNSRYKVGAFLDIWFSLHTTCICRLQ